MLIRFRVFYVFRIRSDWPFAQRDTEHNDWALDG